MTSACNSTANLLDGVRDDQLDARTPCGILTVRELVAHVGGLAVAFAAAARKDLGDMTDSAPGDGGYPLDDHWRTNYPTNLAGLAEAWRDGGAWEGMTRIGGQDLPGEVAGSVGLTEVVIHGWDLARANSPTTWTTTSLRRSTRTSQASRRTVPSKVCSAPPCRFRLTPRSSTGRSRSVGAIPLGARPEAGRLKA